MCHSTFLISTSPFSTLVGTFFAALLCSCGGALSTGCGCVPHSSFGCVPPLDTSPLASGGRPQALTLFGEVGFIARRLRRPEKGNADGVRGIFGTACRVELRPCDRTHLKNGFVPHSYAGGASDKYRHVLGGAHTMKRILRYSWLHSLHRQW